MRTQAKIIDINSNIPHDISETICLKCLYRFTSVYPSGTLLKDLECPKCGTIGFVIKTGQPICDDMENE